VDKFLTLYLNQLNLYKNYYLEDSFREFISDNWLSKNFKYTNKTTEIPFIKESLDEFQKNLNSLNLFLSTPPFTEVA